MLRDIVCAISALPGQVEGHDVKLPRAGHSVRGALSLLADAGHFALIDPLSGARSVVLQELKRLSHS